MQHPGLHSCIVTEKNSQTFLYGKMAAARVVRLILSLGYIDMLTNQPKNSDQWYNPRTDSTDFSLKLCQAAI